MISALLVSFAGLTVGLTSCLIAEPPVRCAPFCSCLPPQQRRTVHRQTTTHGFCLHSPPLTSSPPHSSPARKTDIPTCSKHPQTPPNMNRTDTNRAFLCCSLILILINHVYLVWAMRRTRRSQKRQEIASQTHHQPACCLRNNVW